MEAFYVQLTTLLSLLCGNFLFGFAPLLIIKIGSGLFCSEHFVYTRNRVITVFLVFSGGVFMSTSLLVLVSQTRKHYEAFEVSHHSSKESRTSHEELFPIPEFIVLCGFFATFAMDEFLHYILYHFHSRRTNNNYVRVRFCSCAKRHTECSRTFKADIPDQTLYGLEKKNSALGLEYSEFTRLNEEATNMTTNLLMPQTTLPNYGTVAADDERTNTPVNILTPPPLITDNVVQQTSNTPMSSKHMTSNIFLLAILCCHAVLQGIGIGLIPANNSIGLRGQPTTMTEQSVTSWKLLLILCLQQALLSFVVGNVGLSISKLSTSLFFVAVMSVMSPAGIGIAMLLHGKIYELALCVVKALLCGSLMYFTFYDLLGRPSLKEAPHFSNFVGFSLGAAAVAVLLYASGIV